MGPRIRGLAVVVVVLVTGAFLGSAISQWWTAPRLPDTPLPVLPIFGAERVRVEILNGGGNSGMARSATDELRERGFDVVYFGNDTISDRPTSFVIARTDRVDFARAVADALGIRTVRDDPDANLYLDVSVVLGGEWAPDSIPARAMSNDDRPGKAPWWDPRGWIQRPGAPDPDTRLVDPGETGSNDMEQ